MGGWFFDRWAKFALKVWRSNRGGLRHPYKLNFVTTKECHSRCLHCSIWKVKPENELRLEEIQQIAANSPFLSWIDFTGGEPTDRRDFVEVVQAFVERCPDLLFVHFPTNGLKTKRILEMCARLKVLRIPRLVVTVSVDGPPELNDELRGIPGDFNRAIETFRGLQRLGIESYIGMTLFERNFGSIDPTLAALQERIPGFPRKLLHVNLPHISRHFYENSESGAAATLGMVEAVESHVRAAGLPLFGFSLVERLYRRQVRKYIASGICPMECAALMASCYLSEKGEVYPCTIWNEPLGNVRDHGYRIADVLASARASELRRRLLAKDCANCWTPCEAYQTVLANLLPKAKREG